MKKSGNPRTHKVWRPVSASKEEEEGMKTTPRANIKAII
jgi:hypothetical protein